MSWKITTLGEIIDLQNGYAFKSSEYTDSGYFLMRITNVQQGFIKNKNPKYVTIPHDSKLKKFILNKGDILMSLTGDVGRVGEIKDTNLPAVLNQRVARVIIKSNLKIDKNYLFNLLNSDNLRHQIESKGQGAAQLNVSTNDILSIKISLPPLPIQHKIVEKLDKIFTEIENATAAVEANFKNSYVLYSSAVASIFKKLTVRSVKLSSCSSIGYGYTSKSSISFIGPKYLRITDIQDDSVNWISVPKIKKNSSEVKKFLLKDGDIVFARTGATTGKSYLIKDPPVSVFASYLIRVDVNRNIIEPEFLRHFFRSDDYWHKINAGISGTAQGGFNASKLGELTFPLPDKNEQKKIIQKLYEIEKYSIILRKSQERKSKEFNILKQSILKQAFNGELVKVA